MLNNGHANEGDQTMRINITPAQIIALRSAVMTGEGSYELPTAKGQTLNALIRVGVVAEGTRLLTVQGVSIMHSVCDVEVIASKGYKVSVSDDVESLAVFTLPPLVSAQTAAQSLECTCSKGAPSPGNSPCLHCGGDNSWCAAHYPAPPVADGTDVRFPIVEIHGAEEFDATPDMSALTGDCFYGCGRPVTGMFCDYVGKTEGVCDLDRDKLGDHITVVPVDPAVWGGGSETGTAVVGIVQNTPGMSGTTHYHVPGCRDIAREMKRYGQSQSDAIEFTFHSVAEILAFEYGDIASDSADSGTSEWWSEIVYNAQTDKSLGEYSMGVRIMPCLSIPMGDAGDSPLVMVNGEFRIGETLESPVMDDQTSYNVDSHTRYPNGRKGEDDTTAHSEVFTPGTRVVSKVTGAMGMVVQPYMTGVIESIGTRMSAVTLEMGNGSKQSALIGDLSLAPVEFKCYGVNGAAVHVGECSQAKGVDGPVCSIDDDGTDANDAGFVETMVTKEYELSVIVDESTGATVSLGWIMLEMNAAQALDYDRVAEAYGALYGEGTPRHGWASIVHVHDVADV